MPFKDADICQNIQPWKLLQARLFSSEKNKEFNVFRLHLPIKIYLTWHFQRMNLKTKIIYVHSSQETVDLLAKNKTGKISATSRHVYSYMKQRMVKPCKWYGNLDNFSFSAIKWCVFVLFCCWLSLQIHNDIRIKISYLQVFVVSYDYVLIKLHQ